MPFLRFSRDKRGYESIYLVHAQNRRGKPTRPRVLYWYRTPPGIRVGRAPFDEETRRRLEAQNPDVVFDWPTIVATPMPPPAENEQWRERRRAERAAKQALRAEEAALARPDQDVTELAAAVDAEEPPLSDFDAIESLTPTGNGGETTPSTLEALVSGPESPAEIEPAASDPAARSAPVEPPADHEGRRRRRRGGRRRRGRRPSDAPGASASNQGADALNAASPGAVASGDAESSGRTDTDSPGGPPHSDEGSGEWPQDSDDNETNETSDE